MTADDELVNARRTLDKAQDVLTACREYFWYQAQMNAASHISNRVLYPPIYSAIESVLQGVETFKKTYAGCGEP